MFNITKKSIELSGKTLSIETGKIARQSDGAVIARYGDSQVMCTVVAEKKPKAGIDFIPLTVHYREMSFAAGKIPGGFYKREGRSSEKEVLVSRLIDRPIRPLFHQNFNNETQIICTVLSHDGENDTDILSMIATSAALAISGIPFHGPVGSSRVGYISNQYVLNPTIQQIQESDLDLVVAGTKDSVMMVESEAKELSADIMLGAIEFGHTGFQKIIKMIEEFAGEVNAQNLFNLTENDNDELGKIVLDIAKEKLERAYREASKQIRNNKINEIQAEVIHQLTDKFHESQILSAIERVKSDIVRKNIIEKDLRIDGRDHKKIRNIVTEVGLLSKAHGSALFTRGETQALVVSTLGTAQDEQIIDSLEGEARENFMLHYNFLPYCVGETTPLKAPGRREVGHGKLAYRAIKAVLPKKEDFPYTIRVVSEITESNGSSSMATVCGASMSLMDAGIPIKTPVAGIAMGLIKEGDKFVVLSDIMGDEDHLGDMDFKVAGTNTGITALQMDIKIQGISTDIMREAISQAKDGLDHILDEMGKSITSNRAKLNENAPKITSFKINPEKIKEVIGNGGSIIKKICEVSGAKIDIENDGTIRVSALNSKASEIAVKMIKEIVAEPEVGKVYEGKVVKILEFGAFVNIVGNRDGLLHISELAGERVESVTDIVREGQIIKVLVMDVDSKGKVKLSLRAVDQVTGEINYEYFDNQETSVRNFSKKSLKTPRSGRDKPEKFEKEGYISEKRKYFQ